MGEPSATELLEGIRAWVETESHTLDSAGVNAVMGQAAAALDAAGARVERIEGRDGYGDHLVARSPWGGDRPGVLVLCHLDTVHPPGTLARFPFRVEGDRAFGPGIYDMKGGAFIAVAAYAAIARAARPTPLPIRFVIVSDEEVGSHTSRQLIEKMGVDARYVLVTEPARDGGKIVTGRRGTGRYLVRITGRPAHSGSRPQDGRSAIREMARQILDIEAMTDRARGIDTNVGWVRGGTAANVVPAECEAEVDLRISTMADAGLMHERLMGLKPYDPDVRISVAGELNRPPFERTPANAALFEKARALASGLDIDLQDVYAGGASDGNFVAHHRATLDGLGVDGAGAHTLEEHLLVSSLVPRMRLLRGLMETLA